MAGRSLLLFHSRLPRQVAQGGPNRVSGTGPATLHTLHCTLSKVKESPPYSANQVNYSLPATHWLQESIYSGASRQEEISNGNTEACIIWSVTHPQPSTYITELLGFYHIVSVPIKFNANISSQSPHLHHINDAFI